MEDFNILFLRIIPSRINRCDGSKNPLDAINTEKLLKNLKIIYCCKLKEYDEFYMKTNQECERYLINYLFVIQNIVEQVAI